MSRRPKRKPIAVTAAAPVAQIHPGYLIRGRWRAWLLRRRIDHAVQITQPRLLRRAIDRATYRFRS